MRTRKYYLNLAIHPGLPKDHDDDNVRFLQAEKKVCKVIQTAVEEFDQSIYAREIDNDGNQLTLCYCGEFADLAIFADNVIDLLEDCPFRIEVFFGEEPITGDNLLLKT